MKALVGTTLMRQLPASGFTKVAISVLSTTLWWLEKSPLAPPSAKGSTSIHESRLATSATNAPALAAGSMYVITDTSRFAPGATVKSSSCQPVLSWSNVQIVAFESASE